MANCEACNKTQEDVAELKALVKDATALLENIAEAVGPTLESLKPMLRMIGVK